MYIINVSVIYRYPKRCAIDLVDRHQVKQNIKKHSRNDSENNKYEFWAIFAFIFLREFISTWDIQN